MDSIPFFQLIIIILTAHFDLKIAHVCFILGCKFLKFIFMISFHLTHFGAVRDLHLTYFGAGCHVSKIYFDAIGIGTKTYFGAKESLKNSYFGAKICEYQNENLVDFSDREKVGLAPK